VKPEPPVYFRITENPPGLWRWLLIVAGIPLAASSHFTTRDACAESIDTILRLKTTTPIHGVPANHEKSNTTNDRA
jgi:hypothetical protein